MGKNIEAEAERRVTVAELQQHGEDVAWFSSGCTSAQIQAEWTELD